MSDRTKTPLRKQLILPAGQKCLADPFCYVGRQLECPSAYEPETAVHSLRPTKYHDERKVAVETETLDRYVERHSLSRLDGR
jgi:hypothetical protein